RRSSAIQAASWSTTIVTSHGAPGGRGVAGGGTGRQPAAASSTAATAAATGRDMSTVYHHRRFSAPTNGEREVEGRKTPRPMTFSPERYDRMQYRRCGKSGLLLPALSLGAWETYGGYRDGDVARSCFFRAFDLGITHFDLANNYGTPP